MRTLPLLAVAATLWATAAAWADPAPTTRPDSLGFDVKITVDTSKAPDLADWANNQCVPVLREWYPKIIAELPVDNYVPPTHFEIFFDPKYQGVAETGGTHVRVNPAWIRTELKGEAIGALLHEEVHVVQQPYHRMHGHHMPTWLLEGSCDYIRWFQYEPASKRPRVSYRTAKYDAAYRPTAVFLQWVISKYDKDIVPQMNAANYNGTYSDALWVKYTGHSAADLGAEWKASLPHRAATGPATAPTTAPTPSPGH